MKSRTHAMRREIDRSTVNSASKPVVVDRTPETRESGRPGSEKIAPLAYHYWQQRGCPDGCPEEDWFRAERELSEQTLKI